MLASMQMYLSISPQKSHAENVILCAGKLVVEAKKIFDEKFLAKKFCRKKIFDKKNFGTKNFNHCNFV